MALNIEKRAAEEEEAKLEMQGLPVEEVRTERVIFPRYCMFLVTCSCICTCCMFLTLH